MKFRVLLYSIFVFILSICRVSNAVQKVEVYSFENDAGLSDSDLQYLFDSLLESLEMLPANKYSVEASLAEQGLSCDDTCKVKDASARWIDWIVAARVATFGEGMVATLRLYNVKTGETVKRVNANVSASMEELLAKVKSGALSIRQVLSEYAPPEQVAVVPTRPAPPSPPPTPTTTQVNIIAVPSQSGFLEVVTNPPGARVFVRRHGTIELIGVSPVKKMLRSTRYQVMIRMNNHVNIDKKVLVVPGETTKLKFNLQRIYPWNPYKWAGHAFFWPGSVLTITGLVCLAVAKSRAETEIYRGAENEYEQDRLDHIRITTGVMWGTLPLGLASMTTAIVLWILSPGDEAYWNKQNKISFAPTEKSGAVFLYQRSF